jgi:hypothetical protein
MRSVAVVDAGVILPVGGVIVAVGMAGVAVYMGGRAGAVDQAGGSVGVDTPAPKPHAEHVASSKDMAKNIDLAAR